MRTKYHMSILDTNSENKLLRKGNPNLYYRKQKKPIARSQNEAYISA